MLGVVPLFFAAQQAAEGIIWLTIGMPQHEMLESAAVYTFLAFALVIWPTWAPLALRSMEPSAERRRVLGWTAAIGALVSVSAAFLLARTQPAARLDGHSITYQFGGGAGVTRHLILLAAYVVPTLVPFFVSTVRWAKIIGGALIVSIAVAVVVRHEALTSVWCFFAAVVSVLVVLAVRPAQRARPA